MIAGVAREDHKVISAAVQRSGKISGGNNKANRHDYIGLEERLATRSCINLQIDDHTVDPPHEDCSRRSSRQEPPQERQNVGLAAAPFIDVFEARDHHILSDPFARPIERGPLTTNVTYSRCELVKPHLASWGDTCVHRFPPRAR